MHKTLIFIMMILSISYGESTNKQFIKNNFPNDKCLNFNENYICINGKNRTNKLSNVIRNMKTINFFSKNIDINKEELNSYLYKKLKLSKEKMNHAKAFIYKDEKGKNHQLNGLKQYMPIYNKKLSNEFNQALFKKEKNGYLNNLNDLNFEKRLEPLLGLIRKNSFVLRLKSDDSVTIHFSKDFYNFYFQRFDLTKLELLKYPKKAITPPIKRDININGLTQPITPPVTNSYYSREREIKYIDKMNEITTFFLKHKNKKIDNKGTNFLNKKISYLITQIIKDSLYDGAFSIREPLGEEELYLYQRVYQLFVDFIYLSKKDQKLFINKLLGFNSQFATFIIEEKLIKNFYQNNPIKVFITQTDEYHAPFSDGIYGYLYIHHSDIVKIKNKNIRKYLFMHEKEHILQHFKSTKNRIKDNLKNMQMTKILNQLDLLFKIIDEYDYYQYIGTRILKKEIKEYKTKRKFFEKKIKEYENIIKEEFLASLKTINLNETLSPFEEINIDVNNINQLNTKEQYQYYLMLKKFNKRSTNLRLNAIKKYIMLAKLKKKSKSQKDFSLIQTVNNMYIKATHNDEENTNNFIIDLANETYFDIDKLKKSKSRMPKKIKLDKIGCIIPICAKKMSFDRTKKTLPSPKLSLSETEPIYEVLNQLYNMNELQVRLNHFIDYMELKKSYEENYSTYINTATYTGEL